MAKFWRNTITLEIIGVGEPVLFDNLQLAIHAMLWGECSGKWVEEAAEIDEGAFLKACDDHCTDPEFFGIDEN